MQPRIDWAKGWINYMQLPIVLCSDDANKAIFATRTKGRKAVIRRTQVGERIPPSTEPLQMSLAIKNPRSTHQRDHGTIELN